MFGGEAPNTTLWSLDTLASYYQLHQQELSLYWLNMDKIKELNYSEQAQSIRSPLGLV
jgi:hypothetical protein